MKFSYNKKKYRKKLVLIKIILIYQIIHHKEKIIIEISIK